MKKISNMKKRPFLKLRLPAAVLLAITIISSIVLPSKTHIFSAQVPQPNQSQLANLSTPGKKGQVLAATTGTPTYTISGNIFIDNNGNGTKNLGEGNYAGMTVTLSGASAATTTTDIAGNYTFAGLLAGNYSVAITPPSSYKATTTNPQTVTLNASQIVNFGVSPVYTISGTVFIDTNGNGIQNTGEGLYAGATIALSGDASATTTSNGSGNYSFSNLSPGNYTVTITIPSAYKATTNNPQSITINSNQSVNFGLAPTYNIAGSIFVDANKNGVKDSGESGYQNVVVKLSGPASGLTSTDSNGDYSFTNYIAGTYTITVTPPSGYKNTTPTTQTVTIGPNQTAKNFGIAQAYSIAGTVYIDCNYNGTKDTGENGYRNASLSISGADTGNTTTDTSGNYSFFEFPGSYTVSLATPANYRNTTPASQNLTISNNQTADFGIGLINAISGTAYNDKNSNGVQDPGENVFSNITVTLSGPVSATTTTDNNGKYTFTNLLTGTYTVSFVVPAKHKNTTATSQTVTIAPACSNGSSPSGNTVNFGLIPVYTISGKIFNDNNSNGKIDPGEPYYGGATVKLSGDWTGTTTSNTSGDYAFADRNAGNYTIALDTPSGYRSTTANSLNLSLNSDLTINFGITASTVTTVGGRCTGNTADIVIVIDHSGSMRDPDPATGKQKFSEAKTAANKFIDIMSANVPNVRIGLVQMGGSQNAPGATSPLSAPTNNFSSLKTTITNMVLANPDGGSCFDCAINQANTLLSQNTRPNSQKAVIFMTDGIANTYQALNGTYDDGGSYKAAAENAAMTAAINGVNNQNVVYNTIGIGQGSGNINEAFLKQIADTNGGIYFNDPNEGDLNTIFQKMADDTTGDGIINGTVFNDANSNGIKDTGEGPLANWQVKLSSDRLSEPITNTTDASGNYSFTYLCSGTYTVAQIISPPWVATTQLSYNLDIISGNTYNNINFGARSAYMVSGSVFNDINKNGSKDTGEPNYNNAVNITTNEGTITVNPDGTYTISGLSPGNHTISYSSALPPGYTFIAPKNGPPPSFLVTLGTPCTVTDASTGASCDATGNVINLNFAISSSIPWSQTYDLDLRSDNGYTNKIPATTACTSYASATTSQANNAGIIFVGDGSSDFGGGQSSTNGWIVGGSLYPETQAGGALRVSYSNLSTLAQHAGSTITDLSTLPGCASLSNCTLPANLPNGVYRANDNLTLNSYTFPADKNYVILVNGSLTLNGNIIVPVGSTAIFSAKKDVLVTRNVKASTDACPVPTGQLQGTFIAGEDFIAQGTTNCASSVDGMLNIDGSVVVNANRTGGDLLNQRDLCANNLNYPSFTIKARPDFILNAPTFLMQQSTIFSEEAP
jgi:Mg-chelatase subunit ChlD